jgi:hypothetical protein
MNNHSNIADLNPDDLTLVSQNDVDISPTDLPGYVDVDQSLVERDWLLVVTEDPRDQSVRAVLHESLSGVPGRKIEYLILNFGKDDSKKDEFVFRANIKIYASGDFVFQNNNPIDLTGHASCVAMVGLSRLGSELSLCFKFGTKELSRLKFNIIDRSETLYVSEDPSVVIRRKND